MYPEEVVEIECIEVSLMGDVQQLHEVLQGLRRSSVLQGQHKVQVRLVVLHVQVSTGKYMRPEVSEMTLGLFN